MVDQSNIINNSQLEDPPAQEDPEIQEAQANALLTESEGDESDEPAEGEDNLDLMATNRQPAMVRALTTVPLGQNTAREEAPNDRGNDTAARFEVSQLILDNTADKKQAEVVPVEGNANKGKDSDVVQSTGEQPVCRICLCDDNEVDNPLFKPCKCSGSMGLIH